MTFNTSFTIFVIFFKICFLYLKIVGYTSTMWVALSFNLRFWNNDYLKKWNNKIDTAIRYNEYKYLIYLHKNGTKLTEHMCASAAYYGSLDCLRYICQNLNIPLSSHFGDIRDLCYTRVG